ncbi:MAG: cytochrome ubiquinol oxidase subunit I [Chlamydiota bacterium]
MDAVILSRIQFALTSSFHYIYPPLSIGIGLMLVFFEGMYMRTKNPMYKQIAKFWIKVFGLTFALGVATGLVQMFGFGTNWARYSRFVGDVFGSALGAEGVFAFFLEAGFIGIMLFGWEKVSPRMHYISTVLVAIGSHFSAVWIVVANSWMQTPAGYKIVGEGLEAKAVVTDFWQMVFNPSAMDRLTHVILGCWLSGIFFILSVSAYYMLKKKHVEFSKACMKVGLIAGSVVLVLQLISADSTARGVSVNQPIKLAAIEGIYDTVPYTPIGVVGWVDPVAQKVTGIKIPGFLSFLVYHNFETPVRGLNEFPKDEWPNVPVLFQTYHLMIMLWGAMVACILMAFYFWRKKTLENAKWTLRALVVSVLFPAIANQAGWFTAEMGRQPWVVYKLLRTQDGVSASLKAGQVVSSITMFACLYTLLFILFIYLLNHKIQHGPDEDVENDPTQTEYRDPFKPAKK